MISERVLLFPTVCGASGRGLDSTLFQTLQWCLSSLLGNEKCMLMLSLQEKSASTGRKLIVYWRKKIHVQTTYSGNYHRQEHSSQRTYMDPEWQRKVRRAAQLRPSNLEMVQVHVAWS